MRHRTLSLAGPFLLASAALAGFTPTDSPVSPDGTAAVVDLPAARHIRNVGGSDGAGLCVFTSVQHAADWQNVRDLDGFREWMRRRPGGGWPEKLDKMLAQFCAEKGVPVPPYVQHTGGDESFLELALKTDRVVCVTYAGRDDFYRGRVAHMVNLAHLDADRAAIIDNNRPGVWVWMTRAEFLARWRDMDGGWAVVLLDAPPPPRPQKAQAFGAGPCVCGADCGCKAAGRECPGGCTVYGQADPADWKWEKRCTPDGCRLVKVPAGPKADPAPVGNPPGPDFVWHNLPGVGWGWVQKSLVKRAPAAAQPVESVPENYGVDTSRIHSAPRYSLNGVEVTRAAAMRSLAGGPLADDSDRWHLAAVGDAAFVTKFRADVAALPADVRAKLLVQSYGPADWPVGLYALSAGVSLRRPSPARTAADVGVIPAADYGPGKLAALLASPGGPVAAPRPDAPPAPAPAPAPAPSPEPANPAPAQPSNPWIVLLLAAGIVYLFLRGSNGKKV